jgi:hypothetical protein
MCWEAQAVIWLRGLRIAQGGAKAEAETTRMMTEKVAALAEAQVAAMAAVLKGNKKRLYLRARSICSVGGTTASGFSVAENALASPISPQWAAVGTARRVVSRSCALGSNGAGAVQCRSNREVCKSGPYQRILGMLAYHEAVRKRGASYARKYRPDQHRAHLWRQCQIDSLSWVVGRFVDEARASGR